MQLLRLTTKLLVAMALTVIFFSRDPGEAGREVSLAGGQVAKVDADVPAKAETFNRAGEFEVASIGSLDGIMTSPEPETAELDYVIGTPVVFAVPEIRTDYVLADAPPDMRSEAQLADASGEGVVYVTGTRVNLRHGPGIDTSVVTTLRRGDAAELIGEAGDGWMNIREVKSGSVGYMAARFLSEARP